MGKFIFLLTLTFLSSLCLTVMADEHEHAKHMGPCKADQEKLCKDIKPGEGRIIKCLKEHDATLSADCKESLKKIQAHMPCYEDHEKFCKGMKVGDGKFGPCMKEHADQLSAPCKAFMEKMKKGKHEHGEKPNDD